jgi:hypothetical protein
MAFPPQTSQRGLQEVVRLNALPKIFVSLALAILSTIAINAATHFASAAGQDTGLAKWGGREIVDASID